MPTEPPIEQRVAAIEREIINLKKRLDGALPKQGADWIKEMTGSMKDFPEIDEIARLGAEVRRGNILI